MVKSRLSFVVISIGGKMKKAVTIISVAILAAFLMFTSACGDKTTGPAGSLGVSLYKMVPSDASGILTFNIKKLSSLSVFDKIKEDMTKKELAGKEKFFKNYEDFVDKTGIDPKRDFYSVVLAVFGDLKAKTPDFAIIANLHYDKSKILSILKEKVQNLIQEDYLGSTIYKFTDEKGKDVSINFINADFILAGSSNGLKKIIDLSKGKGSSLDTNNKIMGFLKEIKGNPVLSFVFSIPDELKGMKGSGMFQADFSKAEAVFGQVDYIGTDWTGKIVLVSPNEEGNKKMKTTLDGLKGFGAMAGPEFAELVNSITISASPRDLTISLSISTELLEKLKKKAEQKMKKIKGKTPATFH